MEKFFDRSYEDSKLIFGDFASTFVKITGGFISNYFRQQNRIGIQYMPRGFDNPPQIIYITEERILELLIYST